MKFTNQLFQILIPLFFFLMQGFSGNAKRAFSRYPVSAYIESFTDSNDVIITQNTTYLFPGQEIEIKVFSTCNTRNKIERIEIAGATIPLMKEGVAIFKIRGGSLGTHEIPVDVFLQDERGTRRRHYSVRYTVGQASGCIALDKMNVLYTAVDNIVWIAVTGAGDEKITVSVSGGGSRVQRLGSGKYNVKVSSVTDDCFIDVYVEGKIIFRSQYKVRNLPVPSSMVGSFKSGDSVSASAFRAQAGVSAYLNDFLFEVKYEVVSYSLKIVGSDKQIKKTDVKGPAFSSEAKRLIDLEVKPGSLVLIDNLLVKDAGGRTMKVPALLYYIK